MKHVGGASNSGPSLKGKFDLKKLKGKPLFFIIGGLAIVALLIIKSKQGGGGGGQDEVKSVGVAYPGGGGGGGGMPSNDVDVQAQLDSFSSIIGTQLNSALGGVDTNLTKALEEINNMGGKIQSDTNTSLSQAMSQFEQLAGQIQSNANSSIGSAIADNNSNLNNTLSDFNNQYKEQFGALTESITGIGENSSKLVADLQTNVGSQFQGLTERFNTINSQITTNQDSYNKQFTDINKKLQQLSKPAPKPAAKPAPKPPAKKPTGAIAKPKPVVKKPVINPKPAPKPVVKPKPVAKKPIPKAAKSYTIKKGDTLYSLAKKNKTTVAKLAKDNGIKNPNKIYAGKKLVIKK